ncbi:MAG: Na/Pi symporter [Gammaproteobacteria bacterium]
MMNNTQIIFQVLGGLGMFLLGMVVLTSGLQALAGNVMRASLLRFTRNPVSGAITGAVSTAILQSSSATTVAAVGFVGAGLIAFPEALGIIFGANIGTTITGWLVALLGFKLKLSVAVMPIIFIGMLLRLFAKDKLANIGFAIAGFGVIFVGISQMQEGMGGIQHIALLNDIPADTMTGRLLLLASGIIFTAITQSSSAGIATTLTALFTGLINFEQAAALVVGMDIGTTVTAAIATIGSTVGARRTGLSHVIYNLLTGVGAFMLITPYVLLCEAISPGFLLENAEIALVAFHTSFNVIGVIVVLPVTHAFSRLIIRMIPDREPVFTHRLDKALLNQPKLALAAVYSTVNDELVALLNYVNAVIGDNRDQKANLPHMKSMLDETRHFLDDIHLKTGQGPEWDCEVSIIHALDHMRRLHERCEEEEDRAFTAKRTVELMVECQLIVDSTQSIINYIHKNRWSTASRLAKKTADILHKSATPYRASVMTAIGSGEISVSEGTNRLEAIRWLRRVSKHVARITQHLAQASLAMGKFDQGKVESLTPHERST